MRADIGIGAHEDPGVADEAAQPADGGRPLTGPLQPEGAVVLAQHARRRQVRDQRLPHPDRARARTTPAVRRGERLVDVEVHHVEAGLARLEPAEDGVQVGAVHVGQRAHRVDRLEQLADARLEQAEGRGVRDHHGGRPGAEGRLERVDVDAAVRGRRDGDRPIAGHRRGRGVGPVARVGHEDLVPIALAVGPVVLPDHEDAGQLALGAGRGLEAHRRASRRSRRGRPRAPTTAAGCPARSRRARAGGGWRSPAGGPPIR